jgi:hypothetical protein
MTTTLPDKSAWSLKSSPKIVAISIFSEHDVIGGWPNRVINARVEAGAFQSGAAAKVLAAMGLVERLRRVSNRVDLGRGLSGEHGNAPTISSSWQLNGIVAAKRHCCGETSWVVRNDHAARDGSRTAWLSDGMDQYS